MTDTLCMHKDFDAKCTVARIEDAGQFVLHVEIECTECHAPFRFLKLPPGISTSSPCVNIDGTIASLPIEPEGRKRLSTRMTIQLPPLPEKA